VISGRAASEFIAWFRLLENDETASTSLVARPFPLLDIICRTCSLCRRRLRARRPTIAQERRAEPIPTAKAMVTARPDVVRVSFFFMQLFAPAVAEKQRSPGAQDAIAVMVGMQVTVVPPCIEHADVDFMLVTEHTSVPVVEPAVVCVLLSVLEVLVVLSVVVVDDGVAVVEEAAADAEVESKVVCAAVLEGSLVVVASVVFAVVFPVVFVVVFAVVFALVEDGVSVDESALFFKSSLSSAPVSSLQSRANHTAPTVASALEHPPPIKHSSMSSNRLRSTFALRYSDIDLEQPQVVLETSSSISFCAHFVPVAETIAAVANSAWRKDRIVAEKQVEEG